MAAPKPVPGDSAQTRPLKRKTKAKVTPELTPTLVPHNYDFAGTGDSSSSKSKGGIAGDAEDVNTATNYNSSVVDNAEADDDVADEDLTEADVSAIHALEGRRVLADFENCGAHFGSLLKPLTPAAGEGMWVFPVVYDDDTTGKLKLEAVQVHLLPYGAGTKKLGE
jgi:hypothetical protein